MSAILERNMGVEGIPVPHKEMQVLQVCDVIKLLIAVTTSESNDKDRNDNV